MNDIELKLVTGRICPIMTVLGLYGEIIGKTKLRRGAGKLTHPITFTPEKTGTVIAIILTNPNTGETWHVPVGTACQKGKTDAVIWDDNF